MNEIRLTARQFARLQFGAVALIVAIGTLNYLVPAAFPSATRELDVLDVGTEPSLPTWFATLNLFLAGGLAAILARARQLNDEGLVGQWWAIAVLMCALSIDESAAVHERLVRFGAELAPGLPQIASHAWVIFGAGFVVAAGIFFAPLLWRSAPPLRARLIVAGAVFVTGALGAEVFGAIADHYGWLDRQDLAYKMRRIVEEGAELAGVALFNRAVYDELSARGATVRAASDMNA